MLCFIIQNSYYSKVYLGQRRVETKQTRFRRQIVRPTNNTRDEPRPFIEESSESEIDKNTEFTFDQMTSLRSELFNYNYNVIMQGINFNQRPTS